MKIKSNHLALMIVIFIFGAVAVTSAMGLWITENTKQAAKFEEGELAGQANPADIRGSYTFQDVYNNFGVPVADLAVAFGVTDGANYDTFRLSELESIYGDLPGGKEVGTSSVRWFVALYKGLPITLPEETYLPRSAVEILKVKAHLTPEQLAEIETTAVDLPASSVAGSAAPEEMGSPVPSSSQPEIAADSAAPRESAPLEGTAETKGVASSEEKGLSEIAAPAKEIKDSGEHDTSESEYKVNAKVTFQDLVNWGVSKADIEKVLGVPMPNALSNIKDYISSQGMEFATVRTALQALVDQAKK